MYQKKVDMPTVKRQDLSRNSKPLTFPEEKITIKNTGQCIKPKQMTDLNPWCKRQVNTV